MRRTRGRPAGFWGPFLKNFDDLKPGASAPRRPRYALADNAASLMKWTARRHHRSLVIERARCVEVSGAAIDGVEITVGIGHVVVDLLLPALQRPIHADANTTSSRYILKALGFREQVQH